VEPRAPHRDVLGSRRSFLGKPRPACRAKRCARFDDAEPRASARSRLRERRSALREPRCARFDDVEPHASARSRHRERLSAFRELRCARSDDSEPRASVRSRARERLLALREPRCARFDVVEPRASGRSVIGGTRSIFGATPAACGEARSRRVPRSTLLRRATDDVLAARMEVERIVRLRLEALGARVEADLLDDRDDACADGGLEDLRV
jgi:hypothetical protein